MRSSISNLDLIIREIRWFLHLPIHRHVFPQAFQISSLSLDIDLRCSGLDNSVIDKCLEVTVDCCDQQTLVIIAVRVFSDIAVLDRCLNI